MEKLSIEEIRKLLKSDSELATTIKTIYDKKVAKIDKGRSIQQVTTNRKLKQHKDAGDILYLNNGKSCEVFETHPNKIIYFLLKDLLRILDACQREGYFMFSLARKSTLFETIEKQAAIMKVKIY